MINVIFDAVTKYSTINHFPNLIFPNILVCYLYFFIKIQHIINIYVKIDLLGFVLFVFVIFKFVL